MHQATLEAFQTVRSHTVTVAQTALPVKKYLIQYY
jgi:hypothetical protein